MEYPDFMFEENTGDYRIRTYPNPVLTEVAAPVAEDEFGAEIERIGNQMIELTKRNDGHGLAAPQIGLLKRIFVMNFPNSKHDPMEPAIVCNPVLELSEQGIFAREGCLSLPGVEEQVWRASEVFMQYRTPLGEEKAMVLLGLEARIAQHEADHLEGILFFNRLSRQQRRSVLARYEKARR